MNLPSQHLQRLKPGYGFDLYDVQARVRKKIGSQLYDADHETACLQALLSRTHISFKQ